jgi:hypothetical protein
MSNLIPPHGRTLVHREYIARLVSVYALMIAVVVIAAATLLMPQYLFVQARQETIEASRHSEADSETAFKEHEKLITDMNSLVRELNALAPSLPVTEVLRTLDDVPRTGVRVTGFQFPKGDYWNPAAPPDQSMNPVFQMTGQATSRATLASFRGALEATPLIETAQVPLSDLARDTNLTFTMTVTLSREQLFSP